MSTPPDAFETLRQVNDNLRSALNRLRPEQKHCSAIKPQDFTGLLREIQRAADCLRHRPADSETVVALQKETLEYLSNLEKLKHVLPDLHRNLLAEKTRLETAETHVASAAAWAQASKRTL
jgi:hypothetical protein